MTLSFSRWLAMAAALFATSAAMPATAAALYQIEAVPAAGSYIPQTADAINNKGWVIGSARGPGGAQACYLYADGTTTLVPDTADAFCEGLNDLSDVVGHTFTQAHVWPHGGGARQPLPGMRHGLAINNLGQVAGSGYFGRADLHAAFFSDGVATDLGTFGGPSSMALAINDSGWVAGRADISTGGDRGFRWKPGGTLKQLKHIAGWDSSARDVNERGHVLASTLDKELRLIAYIDRGHGGEIDILPSIEGLDMSARAMNNRDEVISNIRNWEGISSPALTRKGKTRWLLGLLNDSRFGWSLGTALGINDAGQIAGSGRLDGESRAYIASPVTAPF
jgi:probable HAF family extracellular repeat protein